MITLTAIIILTIYFVFLYFVVFWMIAFVEHGLSDDTPEISKWPNVSVAIPAWNEEDCIIKTLSSVLELDYPAGKLEVIVVNDGSTDKTSSVVKKFISKYKGKFSVKLINQKNGGKGSALNHAISIAKGEFFVTMDADSTVKSNALRKIIPWFSIDKNIAAVLPLMKVEQPKNLLQKLQWAEYMVNLFYKRLMAILDCVQVAPGPFSVFRLKVLKKIGGYDTKTLTEDMEITIRLQKYHYKIIQVTTTEVYTETPATLRDFYKQRNRWYKGTLINAYKYKNLAFNREYGDFGMIQMPRLLVEGTLALAAFFLVIYISVVRPLYYRLGYYSLIDFDIWGLIMKSFSNFSFLDLDYMNIVLSLSMGGLVLLLLYFAHKYTNEKFGIRSAIGVPLYMIFYSILSSLTMLGVFIDLIRGKKQRW